MDETTPKPAMPREQEDRLIAAIGYLGILCLIPLLLKKDSAYCQFHGKQGLVVLIAWVILSFANVVPVLGQLVWLVGSIALLILVIMGIVNAMNGKMTELPVLGQFAKQLKF
jgi:fumarate reductase subunit D